MVQLPDLSGCTKIFKRGVNMAKLDKDLLSRMYKKMWEIRHFEQTIYTFFSKGIIHGTCHLSVGEEGTAVGTIFALKKNDYVHGNHRGCLLYTSRCV